MALGDAAVYTSLISARAVLDDIEMVRMTRMGQAKYARGSQLSLAERFSILTA
jgi:hypothetical protein